MLHDIDSMIAIFDRRIEKLDKQIAAIIYMKAVTLRRRPISLSAVPGIGPTVLATLLGELPELGTLDRTYRLSCRTRAACA